jgi:hypothetical protein
MNALSPVSPQKCAGTHGSDHPPKDRALRYTIYLGMERIFLSRAAQHAWKSNDAAGIIETRKAAGLRAISALEGAAPVDCGRPPCDLAH